MTSSAYSFLNTLGVNTHTTYQDTAYESIQNGGVTKITAELSYLGISHIRDNLANSWELTEYQQLAAKGIKFDFYIYNGQDSIATQVSNIALLASSVLSVEGPNETDLSGDYYGGQSGLAATILEQKAIYSLVHTNTLLSGAEVSVYETSMGSLASNTEVGFADFANTHSYFFDFSKPIASQISLRTTQAQTINPNTPTVTTELGFLTSASPDLYPVINYVTQAKLTLDALLDQFNAGISSTYLYQLMDQNKQDYGLFMEDGTPKPVATALHNLTTILADSNSSSISYSGSLNYTIQAKPVTAQSLVLEKSNGFFDLVLWNECQLLNTSTQQPLITTPVPVSVNLGSTYQTVELFDPLVDAAPFQTLHNVSTVKLSLPDHPVIIQVSNQIAESSASSPSRLAPAISVITGVPYTGIRLTGTSEAGSTVTVTDTVGGQTKTLGTTIASSKGAWSFQSASGLGRIDLSTVHDYSVTSTDIAGNTGSMSGGLFLTDTGNDVLSATPGVSDVFAIMSNTGSDLINNFKAASASGNAHDIINFSGRGLNSFSQLQPLISGSSSTLITLLGGKTVILPGVACSTLSAADFRFS